MKILFKLVLSFISGALILILINIAGGIINFHIALNAASAFIAGILGLPGIALLVVLKVIFRNV